MNRGVQIPSLLFRIASLLLAAFFSKPTIVIGSQFTIRGTITHSVYLTEDAPAAKVSARFTLSVSNCCWRIAEEREDGLGYEQIAFDGTNILRVCTLTGPVRTASGEAIAKDVITNIGWIERGDMPSPDRSEFTVPLWVAFASSCYLDGHRATSLPPLWRTDYSGLFESGLEFPAMVTRDNHPPYLPQWITSYSDGKWHALRNGVPFVFDASAPYNLGFTIATYQAEFTNIDQLSIPVHFVLKHFLPMPGGRSTTELRIATIDEGFIEPEVSDWSSTSFTPQLPQVSLIRDMRLVGVEQGSPPTLIVTNGGWIIMPLEKLTVLHRMDGASAQQKEALKQSKARAVLVLMFLSSLFFGGLLIKAFTALKN